MTRLETIDRSNWEAFVSSPVAFLMLGKNDCGNCTAWTAELLELLGDESKWADVRFGKVLIDTPGLGGFKKANPWLAEVDVLPFNVLYKDGEIVKKWPGGGAARLENRIEGVLAGDG